MNTNISLSTYDDVSEKIDSFGEVANGWNFGEGVSATKETISIAKDIKKYGDFYRLNVDAHLSIDGAIYLVFSRKGNNNFIDVTIEPDNTMSIKHENGFGANYDVVFQKTNATINDIVIKLQALCNISESCTYETTVKQREDSPVYALETRQTMVGYPFLDWIAPKNNPQIHAII